MSVHSHDKDHGHASDDDHAAVEEHAEHHEVAGHASDDHSHGEEHGAHGGDSHAHAAPHDLAPVSKSKPYPTKSAEAWAKRLKSHFPIKHAALTVPVRNLVAELNGGSAWSMLKRSKELASVISKHHLVEPGSAVASEVPPSWDNLSAIRTTHKFVKIRNNGDLIFKKDTFWTRMEHKARHVVAAFGFLGFRPLMRL